MTLNERILSLVALGKRLNSPDKNDSETLLKARDQNPWFTNDSISLSIEGIKVLLSPTALRTWTSAYKIPEHFTDKTIALVLAGNIPMVGFHDLLCVLLAGHKAMIKLSAKDFILLPFVTHLLIELEPRFSDRIHYVDQVKSFDAVIATGSDNSSRYFEYYFGKYPHVIRKNRSSCAILSGAESPEELVNLGKDVFSFFGLGCRNVSKLYVPEDYNFIPLLDTWSVYKETVHHHKYCNNYDYQKAILLINQQQFLDAGFVLITESDKIVSPISVVHYEKYKSSEDVAAKISAAADKIQCVVGNKTPASIPFGKAQLPEPWDYADKIDTLKFLCN